MKVTKDDIHIHTSDRALYKRCRRKWALRSPVRAHLVPIEQRPNIHLWFGTGIHFALEDFHGHNRFKDPVEALVAYYEAFTPEELPDDAEETISMGIGMLNHYKRWMRRRELYKTVWLDNEPLVEVKFALQLNDLSDLYERPILYVGTIDRVVKNEHGEWLVQDYKTAANVDTNKLANDPQISTYCWAGEQYLDKEIIGMVYTQFAKKVPKEPVRLANGNLSLNKTQKTTYDLYKAELLKDYPAAKFPAKYIKFLNNLADQETPEGDAFIRSDVVYRNIHSKQSIYEHICSEVAEMLDPDLPLYPNPTRDCSWDCEYRTVCLLMDEGDDWQDYLEDNYMRKEDGHGSEEWREKIKYPER